MRYSQTKKDQFEYNQLIKLTLKVFNHRLFIAMSQSIWNSTEGVFSHSTTDS